MILFQKDQPTAYGIKLHGNEVAEFDLLSGKQVRHRENQVPLDGTLQVSSAEFHVSPFLQKEIPRRPGATENELMALGSIKDSLLDAREFDIENLVEILARESAEDNHLVDPVHKLRRKLAPCRLRGGPVNLLIQFFAFVCTRASKPQPAIH